MERKIGSLFTGIGGLELGVCDTVISLAPYGNDIEWMMGFPKGWVTAAHSAVGGTWKRVHTPTGIRSLLPRTPANDKRKD